MKTIMIVLALCLVLPVVSFAGSIEYEKMMDRVETERAIQSVEDYNYQQEQNREEQEQAYMKTRRERRRREQQSIVTPQMNGAPPQTKGAIDPKTGTYYPGAGNGLINPKTGEFYPKAGNGYINPRTGEFYPSH
jgi:hypothetical protein